MIFIGSNLHEMDLVSFPDSHADLFQGILHRFGNYPPPVLHGAYYVIEKERLVVPLEDMFAHPPILLHGMDHSDVLQKRRPRSRAARNVLIQIGATNQESRS